LLQYPATAVACDCGATTETRTHPRMYGTFPRVLGHYVRERHVLSWEDAIRKMTSLPANIVGLVDRGYLEPGMAADITIFDPRTVIDHATYENPAQLSEGIRYVLVNGKVALRDGKVTGEQGGRVLARTAHMPSRAMTTRTAQRVTLDTTIDALHYAIAISQPDNGRRATGTFSVRDGSGATVLEATEIGVLQAAPQWASFTGRARGLNKGREQAFTTIVEHADPFGEGQPTVTVYVDGSPLAVK
jgi:N-acyl-D-amino-acid deacylase